MVAAFALTGCDELCRKGDNDAALLGLYGESDLNTVYEEHLRLCNCAPPRTTLSDRLADFGEQARGYAIAHLRPGDFGSFEAAISTTASVNARIGSICTNAEAAELEAAATQLPLPGPQRRASIAAAVKACKNR